MNEIIVKDNAKKIEDLIYEIRGKQVMLDSDVAYLYGYSTKRLNEVAKRNKERFPENFCFRLKEEEKRIISSRSQIATLNKSNNHRGKNTKYMPYVFTEYGIMMLAGLLKSENAIIVSLNIIKSFVAMRRFINNSKEIFTRVITIENDIKFLSDKQKETENKFEYIFNKLENKEHIKEKLFLDGQIYAAYSLLINIIREANKEIIIIDNYIDKTILDVLLYKNENVKVKLYTKNIKSKLDIDTFNLQYPKVKINKIEGFHDRFIIIDNKTLYHVGASLKDLGKKCFAINKMDKSFIEMIKTKIRK